MNAQDMLDYSLGQLEGPAREQAEEEIGSDPHLAETLDRLSRAIHRLVDDGETIEPPPGLARRTVAFVGERRRGRSRSILDFIPVKVPFRLADVAVAAGIFLASVLTLVPAFRRSQQQMDQDACGFNLQQLGIGLSQYAALHGHYPYAPPDHPDAPTGTFALTLHESDLLHDLSMLDCPCNGKSHGNRTLPHLDLARFSKLSGEAAERFRKMLPWDYAYNAGFRHASGQPGPVPAKVAAHTPLLADQPDHRMGKILEGNSPNHDGRGQNVLFTDGHVSWHETRRVSLGDPDIFLNDEHQPGPGVNVHDAALVPSICPFSGW